MMIEDYDYTLDCEQEDLKENVLALTRDFFEKFNPDHWDGVGIKPESVDSEHYYRVYVRFNDIENDHLDIWIENDNGEWDVVAHFEVAGLVQLRTDEIGNESDIAKMIAGIVGKNYNYERKKNDEF